VIALRFDEEMRKAILLGAGFMLSGTACSVLFGTSGISDGVASDAAVAEDQGDVVARQDAEAGQALDPDLVGYWPFDEGQGSVAHDLTTQKNDGTLNAGASWIPGKKGGAVAFDGVTGLVTVRDAPSLRTLTTELTFAAWLYLVDEGTTAPFNQVRMMQAVQIWDIKLNTRSPQFEFGGRYAIVDWKAPLGEWHHVAFTFKAGVALKAFVDGAAVTFGTDQFTNTDPIAAAPYGFVFGGTSESVSETKCNCRLDDVRLYRRALAPAEIAALLP
jgi:Concanavalin A-like lectin/glucanases superfamily